MVLIATLQTEMAHTNTGIVAAQSEVTHAVQKCKQPVADRTPKEEAGIIPGKVPAPAAPATLMQSDGTIKLKHQACAVGHICTFEVKQTQKGGSAAKLGARPTGSSKTKDIEQVYVVDIENLGGG